MVLSVLRALGVLLLFVVPARATVYFTVNSDRDEGDTNLLDGACIAPGGGCTLRAAIEQANATPGMDDILIAIQVPRIVVSYPSSGYVITRDRVRITGGTPLPGCGDLLPVKLFPASGGAGAVLERGTSTPAGDTHVAFTVLAKQVRIERLEIRGFATGIEVGSNPAGEAVLSCIDVRDAETGIVYQGGSGGAIVSSAVRGSREAGISVAEGADVRIRKNCIGTALDCRTPDGNRFGLRLAAPGSVEENIIAANDVGIASGGMQENPDVRILNNYIGTDWSGELAVGNRIGVSHWSSYLTHGAEIVGNVIAGNAEVGVQCSRCSVSRNLVGTDAAGRKALPNGIGIKVVSGGLVTGSVTDNLVSGNDSTGVVIVCGLSPQGVTGNVIGTDITGRLPLANGSHGVHVPYCEEDTGVSRTMWIGGEFPEQGNVIAHNRGDGIRLGSDSPGSNGVWGIRIARNSIYSNEGLGISYAPAVSPVAVPLIDSVRTTNGSVRVTASLIGLPQEPYLIELYGNTEPDPSGFGEGRTFVGLAEIGTNQLGFGEVTVEISPEVLPAGNWVTATATRVRNNTADPQEPFRETSSFSNALQVLTTGRPSVQIDPTVLLFGDVAVGDSREIAIEIRNNGDAVLVGAVAPGLNFTGNGFALVAGAGAFSISGGDRREVVVRLAPGSVGEKTSRIEVSHNVIGLASPLILTVDGRGIPSQQAVGLSTTGLVFGSVTVGTIKDLSLTITNIAGSTLVGEVAGGPQFISNGFVFASGSGPYTLGAGESHEVVVRLKPGSPGIKSATLTVSHNAANAPSPVNVTLDGEGARADARIAVSRQRLDFGPVPLGKTAIESFVVTHDGGTERLIGSVVDGTVDFPQLGFFYEAGGGHFDLAPGDSVVVHVAFSPLNAVPVNTGVVVGHNASNVARNIRLDVTASGRLPDPAPQFAASVDTLGFGQVPVGISDTRQVVVSNPGTDTLLVTPSLVLGEPGPFAVASAGLVQSVPPGGSIPLDLSFLPFEIGDANDTLVIAHNAAAPAGAARIVLRGTGIAAESLGRPELIDPPNGSVGIISPMLFRWNPVATATSYVLEVSSTSDFSAPVLQQATTNPSVLDVSLVPGVAHFWRVEARRGDLRSVSNTWSFLTARVNQAPIARNDTVTVGDGPQVYIDVLANDGDPDGDIIRVTAVPDKPLNGIVFINPTHLVYWPNAGFRGNDRFTYEITDSGGMTATAQVYVTVGVATDVDDEGPLPFETRLDPNFPNPFSTATRLPFMLAKSGPVRIALHDILGKRIQMVFDGHLPAGTHEVAVSGVDLPAGSYFCVMETVDGRWARHLALVR